jgi:hypothetical protein
MTAVVSRRESLCKDMQLIVLDKGETAIKSPQDREFVWFIVVKGRCDMLVRAETHGKQFPLRVFEEGETFATPVCQLLVYCSVPWVRQFVLLAACMDDVSASLF